MATHFAQFIFVFCIKLIRTSEYSRNKFHSVYFFTQDQGCVFFHSRPGAWHFLSAVLGAEQRGTINKINKSNIPQRVWISQRKN